MSCLEYYAFGLLRLRENRLAGHLNCRCDFVAAHIGSIFLKAGALLHTCRSIEPSYRPRRNFSLLEGKGKILRAQSGPSGRWSREHRWL